MMVPMSFRHLGNRAAVRSGCAPSPDDSQRSSCRAVGLLPEALRPAVSDRRSDRSRLLAVTACVEDKVRLQCAEALQVWLLHCRRTLSWWPSAGVVGSEQCKEQCSAQQVRAKTESTVSIDTGSPAVSLDSSALRVRHILLMSSSSFRKSSSSSRTLQERCTAKLLSDQERLTL
jgi:hypothetical protein